MATVERAASALGYTQQNDSYFDTLRVQVPEGTGETTVAVKTAADRAAVNFRYFDSRHIGIALDETTTLRDVQTIVSVLAEAAGRPAPQIREAESWRPLAGALARTSAFMTHPVFTAHRSETKMMRYLKTLERRDVGLDRSMIPLGSCTMKLNAASEMIPVTWPEFSHIHPFAPADQVQGYAQVIGERRRSMKRPPTPRPPSRFKM
jgi:glycine dehydrogenase